MFVMTCSGTTWGKQFSAHGFKSSIPCFFFFFSLQPCNNNSETPSVTCFFKGSIEICFIQGTRSVEVRRYLFYSVYLPRFPLKCIFCYDYTNYMNWI